MTSSETGPDRLLEQALGAMSADRDDEAMGLLDSLLVQEPDHVHGRYLKAALHAQAGQMDLAEAGLRAVVADAPGLVMARFQLGQALLVRGEVSETKALWDELTGLPSDSAVGAYARGLLALAQDDVPSAVAQIEEGLLCPQEVPVLANDMRRILAQLADSQPPPAAMMLSGYARQV